MSTSMVCPRHYTLRTRAGHVIRFTPDTPVSVPDEIVHEAMAVNILPVDGASAGAQPADGATPHFDITGPLRDALALRGIDVMVRENDATNFDAGSRPKVAPLNALTGLTLNAVERERHWDRYREIKSNGEELPSHKALESVLEIQGLSTPSAVAEYASALDVPESAIKGFSLREQKKALLTAAVKLA